MAWNPSSFIGMGVIPPLYVRDFFEEVHSTLHDAGIDGVKVDAQVTHTFPTFVGAILGAALCVWWRTCGGATVGDARILPDLDHFAVVASPQSSARANLGRIRPIHRTAVKARPHLARGTRICMLDQGTEQRERVHLAGGHHDARGRVRRVVSDDAGLRARHGAVRKDVPGLKRHQLHVPSHGESLLFQVRLGVRDWRLFATKRHSFPQARVGFF